MDKKLEPFHVAIIQAVLAATNMSQLESLALLATATIIPKNHDNIIESFTAAVNDMQKDYKPAWLTEMVKSIESQKTAV